MQAIAKDLLGAMVRQNNRRLGMGDDALVIENVT
jgi:hypothetical protein